MRCRGRQAVQGTLSRRTSQPTTMASGCTSTWLGPAMRRSGLQATASPCSCTSLARRSSPPESILFTFECVHGLVSVACAGPCDLQMHQLRMFVLRVGLLHVQSRVIHRWSTLLRSVQVGSNRALVGGNLAATLGFSSMYECNEHEPQEGRSLLRRTRLVRHVNESRFRVTRTSL